GKMTRRRFVGTAALTLGLTGLGAKFPTLAFAQQERKAMTTLNLPQLPYALDALAPAMSAETLEYHHGKHHKAYADKGNELIEKAGMTGKTVEEIILAAHGKPEHAGLFNNVAQFWNHVHFWNWMKPNGGGEKLPGLLEAPVKQAFGDFATFRTRFIEAGMGQFGSGWAWLATDDQGNL